MPVPLMNVQADKISVISTWLEHKCQRAHLSPCFRPSAGYNRSVSSAHRSTCAMGATGVVSSDAVATICSDSGDAGRRAEPGAG